MDRKRILGETPDREEITDELEQFLYAISHDLRAPLRQLQGFTELLVQDVEAGDEAKVREDVVHIERVTEKLQSMLDGLLALSRVTRAELDDTVRLRDCAAEAVDTLEDSSDGTELEVRIDEDLGTVRGKKGLLISLFQNLIENAVKYSEGSPVRIEVCREDRDDRTVWSVRDRGIGFEPQYDEEVFAVFEQLDTSTSGVGMGLTICRKIVRRHGGTIWIDSRPGEGTTVYFTLNEAGSDDD